MRNLFLALIVANLAYFAWAYWVDVPPPPRVNEAFAKLPRLKLAEEPRPAQASPEAATQKTAMNGAPGCLSVGPFADLGSSARAASILREKGFDPKQRAEEGQMSEGYWVYIAGMKNQAAIDRAIATLARFGIKDALVMEDPPGSERRLSLGLYSERARAEKRVDSVRRSGLKAEVADHKLPGTVYWVDLVPLSGMNTVPLQDLFAQGVSSRIAVQPCPAATSALPPSPTSPPLTATTQGASTLREATAAGGQQARQTSGLP